MTLSDKYKTPKQEAQAKALKISKSGITAYLCRYTFSGAYFVLTQDQHVPNARGFEIVKPYAPS